MRRIIIDTDAGVDDALALLYALASPNVHIEAITTVHGNVPLEAVMRNVAEVLQIAGMAGLVPVARGSAAPLACDPVNATSAHGEDGLGGWTGRHPAPAMTLMETLAPELITSLARRYPHVLTLVTLGPLTNAALALRADPTGFRMLERVVAMAGAVRDPGNMTAVAEFNVYADPHAAREVLQGGVPFTLVGLDVTRTAVLKATHTARCLEDRCDERAVFLHCVCDQMFSFYRHRATEALFYLHDPLALAIALDPSLAQTEPMSLDVETTGELTRGMIVAERRPWVKTPANADVCTHVDGERFLVGFSQRVFGTSSGLGQSA